MAGDTGRWSWGQLADVGIDVGSHDVAMLYHSTGKISNLAFDKHKHRLPKVTALQMADWNEDANDCEQYANRTKAIMFINIAATWFIYETCEEPAEIEDLGKIEKVQSGCKWVLVGR